MLSAPLPRRVKQVRIDGEESVSVVERELPELREGWVKTKINAAPMCTEYKTYEAGGKRDAPGHEAAGEVVESRSAAFDTGDRVVTMPLYACGQCAVCRTGEYIYCEDGVDAPAVGQATYAEYTLKPDWLVVPVPDGVSDEHAAMACCGLGPTYGANDRMNVDGSDTVLISGAGPVGLGGVITTTHRGARVIVSEPTAFRAGLARDLGADAVIDPRDDAEAELNALTDGAGVDKAIECTGSPAAQRFAIEALTRRGELTFVGEGGDLTIDVSGDMIRNGLSLHGQWHYGRGLVSEVMDVIEASPDKLDAFITHEFPLEEVASAFELQMTRETGKVVLRPWE
jgi:L-iditol 2-dehydrogenase